MKDWLGTFAALFPVCAALTCAGPFPLDAQTSGSLGGTVLDEASLEPLHGATVVILGTARTTETEADGSFGFSEVSPGSLNLHVSMPGYITMVESVEVAPGEISLVQFHLPRLEAMLEGLIVWGEREREDRRTGSSLSEIVPTEEDRSFSAADLLAQRVPGLQITRTGESTGAGLVVQLRGISSVTQSNEPVIYLDGARIGGSGPSGTWASRGLRILEEIPASDIERIRILRGPSAASMYADAANGVILIESRRVGSSRDGGRAVPAASPALPQIPGAGDRYTEAIPGTDISFEMAFVPGGSGPLGSPEDEPGRDQDEGPRREVTLEPFWIGVTEVTEDAYAIFRSRGRDSDSSASPATGFDVDAVSRPSPPYEDPAHGMGGEGRPAVGMTREAALRFAHWLSLKTGRLYRLPTEAEWERACRAGGEDPYGFDAPSTGDGPDAPDRAAGAERGVVEGAVAADAEALAAHAWYEANSEGTLQPVATREPNHWGLHDVHGNAAEWTSDPYDAGFYGSLEDGGRAPRSGGAGQGWGVVRGGAFDDAGPQLRCADRLPESTAWKRRDPQIPKSRWWNTDSPHVGFRLARPAGEHSPEEIRAYWDAVLGALERG